MEGKIYLTGRKTKEASKITVYEGFGACKRCGYALDDKEAERGVCETCQQKQTQKDISCKNSVELARKICLEHLGLS